MEWIWDVDKKDKRHKEWLSSIVGWYIMKKGNYHRAIAQGKDRHEMALFRGTEQECREYIDEQTNEQGG